MITTRSIFLSFCCLFFWGNISHAIFDYLKNDLWVKNFGLLKKFDLLFDLSILINQTEDAQNLIEQYDTTQFIINHTLSPLNIDENNIFHGASFIIDLLIMLI